MNFRKEGEKGRDLGPEMCVGGVGAGTLTTLSKPVRQFWHQTVGGRGAKPEEMARLRMP